jgi:hypothetical protein
MINNPVARAIVEVLPSFVAQDIIELQTIVDNYNMLLNAAC